jgi:divalent metal cation (Fe/Co/Zn/Cd) transporter
MVDKELEPSTTAKNTTILDAFLKLGGGLISGSMGLIADGTDATMDTVEAVWFGWELNITRKN